MGKDLVKPYVQVVEVGPRDGLQSEPTLLESGIKVAWIQQLAEAGLQWIEASAFVHPQRIPSMADAEDVCRRLLGTPNPTVTYSALVPNKRGLERALATGLRRVAVFTAASDSFTQHNIGITVEESLQRFQPVVAQALTAGATVRGYVSTCIACPYEGQIAPEAVRRVADALFSMGCDQVSLGDTLGVAVPKDIECLLGSLLPHSPVERLSLHCHDTYGTALANIWAGLQMGIRSFDSSAGGLGGCPYAPGASGNLATEDLVYFLHQMGYDTGIRLDQLVHATRYLDTQLTHPLPGRAYHALQPEIKIKES